MAPAVIRPSVVTCADRSLSETCTVSTLTKRLSALEALIPAEQELIAIYEKLLAITLPGDNRDQLSLQLGLKREHLFTQEWLLKNAGRIKGLS